MIWRLLRRIRRAGTNFAAPGCVVSVEASNLGAMVGAAGSVLFAALLGAAGLTLSLIVALGVLPFYALAVWLNVRGRLRLARHMLGTLFLAEVLALTWLLSTVSGVQVLLLIGIPMGLVMFAPDELGSRVTAIGSSVLCYAATLPGYWGEPVEPVSRAWLVALGFVSLLAMFAGFTVVIERFIRALHLREAQQREFATTDDLTGLPKRRHILAQAAHQLAVATRYQRAFSVVLVDIDHFKWVNDTNGHLEGDLVLREVARRLSDARRAADLVGRYGGEEFVMILPETPLDGARIVADRVRRYVEAEQFALKKGHCRITVSLGVAGVAAGEKVTLDEVLRRADEALYVAKRAGRNRVELWAPAA